MPNSTDAPDFAHHLITSPVALAFDWVSRHLNCFTPFDDDDTYRPSRTKPFVELAIMLAVYAAVTGDRTSPAVQRAAQLLQAASERPDFTDWTLRFPADIVNYAELCAAVDELGGDVKELRHRLQSAVDAGAVSHIERQPHRILELRVALDWAGVTHSLPSTSDICAQTILSTVLSAPLLSDSAIYAITHVIIFGSRFGIMRDALPEWLHSAPLRSLLCDLLVVTSQERNWDLLGELLLCWDCMGFKHDLVTSAGWTSFLEAFRADGAVLSRPPKNVDDTVKSDGISSDHINNDSDFSNVYHTTLVAILAGTVMMNRSRLHVTTSSASQANGEKVIK